MKFKIISDTFIRGKAHMTGTTLELDERDQKDFETMGLLYHANRIQMVEDEAKQSSRSSR